ncbi:MAG TPA: alpha/beta hydrolase [Stellaceae bacterium]|nr:alpha/beta hydrolase [Stellaceae bacterium]
MDSEIQRGIEYARHDGVALQGDLYAPKGKGPHPVMVAVHGGGWQLGARDSYRHWGPVLAEQGIALFAVSYRLAKPGEPTYPAAVHDIRAAVQFVKGRADALGLDAARVGLMGDSAGAHLAALVALAGDQPEFAQGPRGNPHAGLATSVKALIGVYGVYDLALQWNHDIASRPRDSICEKFLGVAPMDDRHRYFAASPHSYAVTAANATAVLLAWGAADDIVDPKEQSEPFLLALKQARFYARSVVFPGAGHFWMSDPIAEHDSYSGRFAPRVLRFLLEKL